MIDTRPAPQPEPDSVDAPGQSKLNKILLGDKKRAKRRIFFTAGKRKDPDLAGMWRIRTVRAVLWAMVALGVFGGVKAIVPSGAQAATAKPEMSPVALPRDVGVGGFAELYVSTWIGAGQDNAITLTPYYSTPVDLTSVAASNLWAARTAAVDVVEAGEDYWAVIVAAEVLRLDDDEIYQPAGVRYYSVGVLHETGAFTATGLPAQVPPPATLDVPELVIDTLLQPSGELEPIAEALDGFFDALLAGAGDIERYISPDTRLTAISPAPFVDTDVRTLGARPESGDPDKHLVRVEIAGVDGAGNAQIMQYTVTLTQRDQRWEVVELVSAPPVGPQQGGN